MTSSVFPRPAFCRVAPSGGLGGLSAQHYSCTSTWYISLVQTTCQGGLTALRSADAPVIRSGIVRLASPLTTVPRSHGHLCQSVKQTMPVSMGHGAWKGSQGIKGVKAVRHNILQHILWRVRDFIGRLQALTLFKEGAHAALRVPTHFECTIHHFQNA